MLKKTMLLAAAVAVFAALAPAMTQADVTKQAWHNGAALENEVTVAAHGSVNFTSSAGGIACEAKGVVTLTPTSSTGEVTALSPTATSTCTYSGNLDNLCGTVDEHLSTGLPWTAHGTTTSSPHTYKLAITGFHTDMGGTGIFCPNVTLKGDLTLIFGPNPTNNIPHELTIHGTLASNLGTEVTLGGTVTPTPTTTYGLEP